MSTDKYVYEGTEKSLEGLLMWWGTAAPFEHAEDCTQDPNSMHCCYGVPNWSWNYALEASNCASHHPKWSCLCLKFTDLTTGITTEMKAGAILYRGEERLWVENA